MSAEIRNCEERMGASQLHWNMIVEPGGGRLLANDIRFSRPKRFYRLTPRQFELLDLELSGAGCDKRLAYQMGISPQTFRNSKNRILKVFGIPKRHQGSSTILIRKLVSDGILSIEPRIPEEDWIGIREQLSTRRE